MLMFNCVLLFSFSKIMEDMVNDNAFVTFPAGDSK